MPERIEDVLKMELMQQFGVAPEREWCPPQLRGLRKWKWDLAYPSQKLLIEVHGKHHAKIGALRSDREKMNAAIALGYRTLEYPADRVLSKGFRRQIVEQISRVLHGICIPEADARCISKVEK